MSRYCADQEWDYDHTWTDPPDELRAIWAWEALQRSVSITNYMDSAWF